jgi:hypothetical protein
MKDEIKKASKGNGYPLGGFASETSTPTSLLPPKRLGLIWEVQLFDFVYKKK